ncbi:MAG: serine protease AprX [Chloroflexota bacterium]|jgi:serine protease AprX|nr:serine protease AprX [Chloroflexota bacterium]
MTQRRISLLASFALILLMAVQPASAQAAARPSMAGSGVSVIVRADAGANRQVRAAIARTGGTVERAIGLIRGFVARVPAGSIRTLRHSAGVTAVTANVPVELASSAMTSEETDLGTLDNVRHAIGADAYWAAGYTGEGVDVAVIDSGVAPVPGLSAAGSVINGPDLSFESQDPDLRYLDTFGHGTHMSGIIAGSDPAHGFYGVAPGARIVSVKVADAFGTTDLSQILAAIDWVVKHRHDHSGELDLDIRVLNLSFGTNGVQDYTIDPLAYAVEQAWKKGIFVAVAGGNEGYGTEKLNNPAYDPFVMAVGASNPNATADPADDLVAEFSSRGDAQRHPDLVAPGTSIVSLRDPGSYIDRTNPAAVVGPDGLLFRGSGTSQATAVVSGAAALVIQQRPGIKPDELKKLLTSTSNSLPGADPQAQGAGQLDLADALGAPTPSSKEAKQGWPKAKGTGSLESARGGLHLGHGGVKLKGAKNIFGDTFNSAAWSSKSDADSSWDDGSFLGRSWTGRSWTSTSWTGIAWKGRSWTGSSWAGRSWTSAAWTGRSWTSSGWSGGAWTGRSWTSSTWTGNTWSSAGWGT